ncbi:MAG: alpha/beta hydrolase [Minwuia sp.]|uniref:alpha/beta hydrolase n=1 Tax=Minwuia sp. TaxID=2493630 RepID=UPI003A895D72
MTVQELDAIVELLTSRPQPENPPPSEMRERFEKLAQFLPLPDDASVEAVDVDGIASEWVAAPGVSASRVVLYLHGGGYVIGSPNTHRRLAYDMSKAADARVLVIDYRLGPESPFPAAIEDAVKAYRWLLANGSSPANIAISGDSAGGGLTMATLISLRDKGVDLPACAVPISPWVDLEGVGETMTSNHDIDPMVKQPGLGRMADFYLNGANVRDPLASPIHADLKGLPPLLIQVGTRETLLDNSRRLHRKAIEDGVTSTLEENGGMIHVWHLFAPMLSEGRDAIDRAGRFIQTYAV